jgi:hypothetical protein
MQQGQLDRPSNPWSWLSTVSFIKQLFSHHRQTEQASSDTVNWPVESGKEHAYTVYPINTGFQPLPGNFIYAKQDEDGRWTPIYITQTGEFNLEPRERMNPWASAHNTI